MPSDSANGATAAGVSCDKCGGVFGRADNMRNIRTVVQRGMYITVVGQPCREMFV